MSFFPETAPQPVFAASAEKPRVSFAITRAAPRVVPGNVPGDASGDAGDTGAIGGPPPAGGAPNISAVAVEPASVILGSRRAATATIGTPPSF